MISNEKDELWALIEDACNEWFGSDDDELWKGNQLDQARVQELFEIIPTED